MAFLTLGREMVVPLAHVATKRNGACRHGPSALKAKKTNGITYMRIHTHTQEMKVRYIIEFDQTMMIERIIVWVEAIAYAEMFVPT